MHRIAYAMCLVFELQMLRVLTKISLHLNRGKGKWIFGLALTLVGVVGIVAQKLLQRTEKSEKVNDIQEA